MQVPLGRFGKVTSPLMMGLSRYGDRREGVLSVV